MLNEMNAWAAVLAKKETLNFCHGQFPGLLSSKTGLNERLKLLIVGYKSCLFRSCFVRRRDNLGVSARFSRVVTRPKTSMTKIRRSHEAKILLRLV